MLKIYISRHGQNEDNANGILNGHRDLPLTDLGEAQAVDVANEIRERGFSFDVVLCSPLKRAQRTAEIISDINNLPKPQVNEQLIERNFGVMTGIEISRIEELCAPSILRTETINYFLSPEGAETFPNLIERAGKLLDELHETYKDGSILLVTHGDIGKMLYANYYNLNWKDVLAQFHFGNSELILLSEDSEPFEARIFTMPQHNA